MGRREYFNQHRWNDVERHETNGQHRKAVVKCQEMPGYTSKACPVIGFDVNTSIIPDGVSLSVHFLSPGGATGSDIAHAIGF